MSDQELTSAERKKLEILERQSMKSEKSGGGFAIAVLVVILICCFIASICFGGFLLLSSLGEQTSVSGIDDKYEYRLLAGEQENEDQILVIKIVGPIYADADLDGAGGLFGVSGTFGYEIKSQLYNAAEEESVKGIILEINSPGGTINGSAAISDGVEYYREKTGKPVIAWISGMGASGSYWAAASADEIIVDTGSIVGSIGVIFGPLKYYDGVVSEGGLLEGEVVTVNGIETTYFTAGEGKDFGNPYRDATEAEKDIIQASVNNEYAKFVQYVSERRDIAQSKIREQIGAHVYGVDQALDLKLIDSVGTRQDSYTRVAELAGVSDYKVVERYLDLGFFDALFGAALNDVSPATAQGASLENTCYFCNRAVALHGNPTQF